MFVKPTLAVNKNHIHVRVRACVHVFICARGCGVGGRVNVDKLNFAAMQP